MSAARDTGTSGGPPTGDNPRELLSAWIDGELTADEYGQVESYLAQDPDARAELEQLRVARALVRELPPVDPPFGFYERMLQVGDPRGHRRHRAAADARATRRPGRGFAAVAVAAVAASFVLLAGLTPAVDGLVPPVEAFAARHEQMAAEPAAARAPVATTTTPVRGMASFNPMPAEHLDVMAPAEMDRYRRIAGYQAGDVVHVVYSDGTFVVSIYEQPGTVIWSGLPAGDRMTIGRDPAWTTKRGQGEILVIERRSMVFTMIASAPHEEMMEMAAAMPARATQPGLGERVRRACEQFVDSFGLGLAGR